jgi:Asparaginase, N-terminal
MATVSSSNSLRLFIRQASRASLSARGLILPRLSFSQASRAAAASLSWFSTLPPPSLPPPPPPPPQNEAQQRCDDKAKLEQEKGGGGAAGAAPDNKFGVRKRLPGESHESVMKRLMGQSMQAPAGPLWKEDNHDGSAIDSSSNSNHFIPEVQLHATDGRQRKRVLMLCTGGTLTMAPDASRGGALAPVQGALSAYMHTHMHAELNNPAMPEVVLHEYTPFVDSSDLGPADWARLALDIKANYHHCK